MSDVTGRSGPILVSGASGMLGSAVIRLAVARGYSVVGTHHRTPVTVAAQETVRMPLEGAAEVEALLARVAPAAVIHCAALTNVDYCEDNSGEAVAVNAAATGVLARAAARCGARFLYVSTDAVFDGARGWYEESDACRPVNVYAASKLQGEVNCLAEHAAALVVRLAPFGWSARPDKRSLAEWVLCELRAGRAITGFVDAIFTPMYAGDVAQALLDLVRSPERTGVYHLGSRDAASKYEFARALASASDLDEDKVIAASISSHPFHARRPMNVSLATAKLSHDTGWTMPTIGDGIARLLIESRNA
jgi:dTDP-4-dehydrorhamnose reductase